MKAELEELVEKMITGGILFEEAVKEFEKHFILKVIYRHRNNLSKAAEELGIHRNTLSKRLHEYLAGSVTEEVDNKRFPLYTSRRRPRLQSFVK